ncbi:unnamed protein product [Urochloa decumbens]|uniref:Uncharacterized protein n=1 Tax=Urochloa decumbens TaxID=240449 RepID=A0ABC8W6Z3_9POAL
MVSAAVCPATILLLAAALFASVYSASHLVMAVEATDHAITKETTELLPVHNDRGKEDMEEAKAGGRQGSAAEKLTSLVSAEEKGRRTGSYWGKKLDGDDDSDDSDHDSDSDHDHDHDSDSDHDHDHNSDSDHDHDSDSDSDHDHDSDSGHNHHESDSDDNDDDYEDGHNTRNGRAHGRKGAPGGKHDDKLPKVVKKV